MSEQLPVTVAVKRADGSIEQVRVGTAVRTDEGFELSLGAMSIGATPVEPSAQAPRSAPSARSGYGPPMVFPNYGRSKGAPIAGATLQDLEYYANGARRSLADPSKARFHDKERELLAVIEAELARQGHALPPPTERRPGGPHWSPPPEDPEPPPIGDDDVPF